MRNRLSKEELTNEFWRYYAEFGKYPFKTDMDKAVGYPSISQYNREWGKWSSFVDTLGIYGTGKWYLCDEEILRNMYRTKPQEDIISSLMFKKSWSAIKQKASQMGLERDLSATKRKYQDLELLISLIHLKEKLDRTPKIEDLAKEENMPTHKVFAERFGSWNDALLLIGEKPNTYFNHTKDYIMKEAKEFYDKNKRSPQYNELSFTLGMVKNYWENWNKMLLECELPLKTSRGLTQGNQEEYLQNNIDDLLILSKFLKRIPVMEEYHSFIERRVKRDFLPKSMLYDYLKMNYSDFCLNYLSEEILSNPLNKILYDKNKNRCFSYSELRISNILIDSGLFIEREKPYCEVLDMQTEMRFDWVINFPSPIYVEYFGLYREDRLHEDTFYSYYHTTKKKIKLCEENNITLIDIYPKDLEKNYKGLLDKFKNLGIQLDLSQIDDFKQAI